MKYVQEYPVSKNSLANVLLSAHVLTNQVELKAFLDEHMQNPAFKQLLDLIFSSEFIELDNFTYPQVKVDYYKHFDKALQELPYYTKDNNYYGTDERKRNKLSILLETLTFVEADVFLRLIKKDIGSMLTAKNYHAYIEKLSKKEANKKGDNQNEEVLN